MGTAYGAVQGGQAQLVAERAGYADFPDCLANISAMFQ